MTKMFRLFLFMACIAIGHGAFGQSLDKFFATRGVASLCEMAHVTNYFLEGTYTINSSYVDVSITGWDKNADKKVYTDLRLVKGTGGQPFSDIIIKRDTDDFPAFAAFQFYVELLLTTYKAILGQEEYQKTLREFEKTFNAGSTNWTGKDWAVFAINLDYYSYMLTGK